MHCIDFMHVSPFAIWRQVQEIVPRKGHTKSLPSALCSPRVRGGTKYRTISFNTSRNTELKLTLSSRMQSSNPQSRSYGSPQAVADDTSVAGCSRPYVIRDFYRAIFSCKYEYITQENIEQFGAIEVTCEPFLSKLKYLLFSGGQNLTVGDAIGYFMRRHKCFNFLCSGKNLSESYQAFLTGLAESIGEERPPVETMCENLNLEKMHSATEWLFRPCKNCPSGIYPSALLNQFDKHEFFQYHMHIDDFKGKHIRQTGEPVDLDFGNVVYIPRIWPSTDEGKTEKGVVAMFRVLQNEFSYEKASSEKMRVPSTAFSSHGSTATAIVVVLGEYISKENVKHLFAKKKKGKGFNELYIRGRGRKKNNKKRGGGTTSKDALDVGSVYKWKADGKECFASVWKTSPDKQVIDRELIDNFYPQPSSRRQEQEQCIPINNPVDIEKRTESAFRIKSAYVETYVGRQPITNGILAASVSSGRNEGKDIWIMNAHGSETPQAEARDNPAELIDQRATLRYDARTKQGEVTFFFKPYKKYENRRVLKFRVYDAAAGKYLPIIFEISPEATQNQDYLSKDSKQKGAIVHGTTMECTTRSFRCFVQECVTLTHQKHVQSGPMNDSGESIADNSLLGTPLANKRKERTPPTMKGKSVSKDQSDHQASKRRLFLRRCDFNPCKATIHGNGQEFQFHTQDEQSAWARRAQLATHDEHSSQRTDGPTVCNELCSDGLRANLIQESEQHERVRELSDRLGDFFMGVELTLPNDTGQSDSESIQPESDQSESGGSGFNSFSRNEIACCPNWPNCNCPSLICSVANCINIKDLGREYCDVCDDTKVSFETSGELRNNTKENIEKFLNMYIARRKKWNEKHYRENRGSPNSANAKSDMLSNSVERLPDLDVSEHEKKFAEQCIENYLGLLDDLETIQQLCGDRVAPDDVRTFLVMSRESREIVKNAFKFQKDKMWFDSCNLVNINEILHTWSHFVFLKKKYSSATIESFVLMNFHNHKQTSDWGKWLGENQEALGFIFEEMIRDDVDYEKLRQQQNLDSETNTRRSKSIRKGMCEDCFEKSRWRPVARLSKKQFVEICKEKNYTNYEVRWVRRFFYGRNNCECCAITRRNSELKSKAAWEKWKAGDTRDYAPPHYEIDFPNRPNCLYQVLHERKTSARHIPSQGCTGHLSANDLLEQYGSPNSIKCGILGSLASANAKAGMLSTRTSISGSLTSENAKPGMLSTRTSTSTSSSYSHDGDCSPSLTPSHRRCVGRWSDKHGGTQMFDIQNI